MPKEPSSLIITWKEAIEMENIIPAPAEQPIYLILPKAKKYFNYSQKPSIENSSSQ